MHVRVFVMLNETVQSDRNKPAKDGYTCSPDLHFILKSYK